MSEFVFHIDWTTIAMAFGVLASVVAALFYAR
jgi:hypothetical protein